MVNTILWEPKNFFKLLLFEKIIVFSVLIEIPLYIGNIYIDPHLKIY